MNQEHCALIRGPLRPTGFSHAIRKMDGTAGQVSGGSGTSGRAPTSQLYGDVSKVSRRGLRASIETRKEESRDPRCCSSPSTGLRSSEAGRHLVQRPSSLLPRYLDSNHFDLRRRLSVSWYPISPMQCQVSDHLCDVRCLMCDVRCAMQAC